MFHGRTAASDTELEAAVAQLIEHADLFDQTQRMIERQQIDERTETQPRGAARNRRKKDAR